MGSREVPRNVRPRLSPYFAVVATTLFAIAVSLLCLFSGCFIIFQNLFYIPIAIACIHYGKRGFVFSVFISGVYFCLILSFSHETVILLQAFIRAFIFVLIAGIITQLSSANRRTEESLRKSRELLSEMTARFPGVAYQFYARPNGEKGFRYVSEGSERIFGIKPDLEKFFGDFCSLVVPEEREDFLKSIEKAVHEGAEWKYEGMLQKPSGTKIWFSGNSTPSPGENEIFFDGILTDITERKALEAERRSVLNIKASTEAKSKFTAMVSHELRSPLAVTKEALDIVAEGMVGSVNDEQKDILRVAKSNIDRLSRLINNVLDFHKIESGKMEFDILENDLNEAVTEVIRSMSVLARRKGLELKMELEKDLPRIKFDRDRIIQVLTNLVSNAINSTEKGSVTVASKKENNVVHVCVKDTGSGIPPEDMSKLFHPFGLASNMKGKKKSSTGLGLAISREITLAHHGKIWAESEVGKGTTSHFTLPL